jgi:hypothetical protein
MKYTAALLSLAASAAASVAVQRQATCASGTYRCTTTGASGIEVCNVGQFVLVGRCPAGTTCQTVTQAGGSSFPACITPAVPGGACTTPGRYQCFGNGTIVVCNAQKALQSVGNCPSGTHCGLIGGIPYCLNN